MKRSTDGALMSSTELTTTRHYDLAASFLRLGLGAGLLSAVADRLGFWGPPGTPLVSWGNFHNFLLYTAKLNPWCPAACLPLLGVVVTIAEAGLGMLLILGLWMRLAGLLNGIMALTFAAAMTFVLGIHAPLNYEVFVFSAASFLLATLKPDKLSLDAFRVRSPHKELRENLLVN